MGISLAFETLEDPLPYLTELGPSNRHIGFYTNHHELKLILEKVPDPASYSYGCHMGFYAGKEKLGLLLEYCKDPFAFLTHKDSWGQHCGFNNECTERLDFILDRCSDRKEEFIFQTNRFDNTMGFFTSVEILKNIRGEHLGFFADEEVLNVALKYCGDKQADINGEHMGFENKTDIVYLLTRHCKDKVSFINHTNKNGQFMRTYSYEEGVEMANITNNETFIEVMDLLGERIVFGNNSERKKLEDCASTAHRYGDQLEKKEKKCNELF